MRLFEYHITLFIYILKYLEKKRNNKHIYKSKQTEKENSTMQCVYRTDHLPYRKAYL